jgi:hypothetical protein
MMPAQFVATAVAMRPNAGPQPFDLGDKFTARKGQKIIVHRMTISLGAKRQLRTVIKARAVPPW